MFTRYAGNLAQSGAVSFQFNHCGQFLVGKDKTTETSPWSSPSTGADDVRTSDGLPGSSAQVMPTYALAGVLGGSRAHQSRLGGSCPAEGAARAQRGRAAKVQTLLDALEDLDDVQHVFSSHEVAG